MLCVQNASLGEMELFMVFLLENLTSSYSQGYVGRLSFWGMLCVQNASLGEMEFSQFAGFL
jgi:hypothetical protein